jgi:8-oxo-dGTP pyrophosphatase MutT (NUDIX family)
MTPGGGVMDGESAEEAAARLLWDQTGVGDIDVGPCVWLRTNLYPWDGEVYKHQERFCPVVVEEAQVTDQYWNEVEKKVLADFKWWTFDEIKVSDAFFRPPSLHELLPPIIAGDYPSEPIAIGA